MSWGFDLQVLYSGAARADGDPLIAPFSEGEVKVKQVARGMNAASAPGPDGLGPSFYAATLGHHQGRRDGVPPSLPV